MSTAPEMRASLDAIQADLAPTSVEPQPATCAERLSTLGQAITAAITDEFAALVEATEPNAA